MEAKSKEQAVFLAREIKEAMETLTIALSGGADEIEMIEGKNVVASALRSYKSFLESLTPEDKKEAQEIFAKRIEHLASQAKRLK